VALAPGTRLGPYEVIAQIGAGGMGEVYKARDTRLDRVVAVKVLAAQLADDAHFRDRFAREAKVISALDHPHICTLYDVGTDSGAAYLVMQYLDGEPLDARLRKGALPLGQALHYAVQIADALDRAHRAGIVHRDLKPGNIMLTKAGAVLLDFGLAKATTSVAAPRGLSMLPTTPANLTAQGTILGTFQYMAPEQLEGREADARTDIFALGAVVYEMFTGKKAFDGRSQASLTSSIMSADPPPLTNVLSAATPALDHVVKRCLAKNPDDRWQTAGDVMRELKWIADAPVPVAITPSGVAKRNRRFGNASLVANLALVVALAVIAATYFRRVPADSHVYRSTILATLTSDPNAATRLSLSPDGRRLAFIGLDANGNNLIYVRALDGLAAQPLSGTAGAQTLFWSPDGRFLSFAADNKLKKIDATGGDVLVLCDAPGSAVGSWNQFDVIVFTRGGPLFRVSAAGGTPSPVTTLDVKAGETAHVHPFFLPDGRHFLYLAQVSGGVPHGIYLGALDSTERTRLVERGSNAQYAQGALLFLQGTTLMAQPFDAGRLALAGDAKPLAAEVQVSETSNLLRTGTFSVSNAGVLVYAADPSGGSDLVWFDRAGRELGRLGDRAKYMDVMLAPDGAHAAVSVMDATATRDMWIYDLTRGVRNRLTSDPEDDLDAKWSPDSTRVVFGSRRNGHLDLYMKAANGVGAEQLLVADDVDKYPQSWSPDGRFLLYVAVGGSTGAQELWVLPLTGTNRRPFRFLQTRFSTGTGQFSPDGRWIAFRSNETGRFDVYIVGFLDPGEKWPVSTGGGNLPRWRRDGREIFYVGPGNVLMSADVTAGGARVDVSAARRLFQVRPVTPRYYYDVSADGQRFLVNTAVESSASIPVTLLVNWPDLLKK
jgi:serine/threonine protein kinase/Tol biopolymer transport system component